MYELNWKEKKEEMLFIFSVKLTYLVLKVIVPLDVYGMERMKSYTSLVPKYILSTIHLIMKWKW